MNSLPKISTTAFWDVQLDFNSAEEFEKYSAFIIAKIFEYGTFDDIIKIIIYYGKRRIKKEIVDSDLKYKTISLCCVLFNLKKTDFKCYRKRLLNQTYWNY